MKQLRERIRASRTRTSALILGAYMSVMGFWIMLPFKSFGPAFTGANGFGFGKHHGSGVETAILFNNIGELTYGFGFLVIGLGVLVAAYYLKYAIAKWFLLLASSWWIFVTTGYIMTLWNGTTTITAVTALIWSVVTYLKFDKGSDLPFKNNADNIKLL